jgi:hypothetical protein
MTTLNTLNAMADEARRTGKDCVQTLNGLCITARVVSQRVLFFVNRESKSGKAEVAARVDAAGAHEKAAETYWERAVRMSKAYDRANGHTPKSAKRGKAKK